MGYRVQPRWMGARGGHCGMQTTGNLVSKMILKQGGLTYGIMADGVGPTLCNHDGWV